jgi:hypothetical protein
VVPLALVIAAACGSADGPYTYEKTGLTELVLTFGSAPRPAPGLVKATLVELGLRDIQIAKMDFAADDGSLRPALRVQFALREWPTPKVREEVVAEINRAYGSTINKIEWGGSAIHIRGTAPLDEPRLRAIVSAHDLVVGAIQADHDVGAGEDRAIIRVRGMESRVERALEAKLAGTDVVVESAMSVGPLRSRSRF